MTATTADYPDTALVSYYDDAGSTACGFHATYGVASRTLPCGSHVTFDHDGTIVTATVQDRGPYIYSRLFDLNETLRAALHCGGLCWIRYRLGDPPPPPRYRARTIRLRARHPFRLNIARLARAR